MPRCLLTGVVPVQGYVVNDIGFGTFRSGSGFDQYKNLNRTRGPVLGSEKSSLDPDRTGPRQPLPDERSLRGAVKTFDA